MLEQRRVRVRPVNLQLLCGGPLVVTERWLEACQKRGVRADEADFLIDDGRSAAKRARRR